MNQRGMWLLISFIFQLILLGTAHADGPTSWQMGFQKAASPTMEKITALHTSVLWIIIGISGLVFLLLGGVIWRFRASQNPHPSKTTHHTGLEILWTAVPAALLVWIASPSMKLLYFMDKTEKADITLKVTGHQWYWGYEYPDEKIAFDSQLILDKDLNPGQLRLLSVDQEAVVPVGKRIRLLMTSSDVLHAWAIPALGIKQDTIPGRLRETWVQINHTGVYYGQCSEICGKGHGFMPIVLRAVSEKAYQDWLREAKKKFS